MYEPSLLVDETIFLQSAPLFVEYSILTFSTSLFVQVTFCMVPACQFSPPFGDVTVRVGLGCELIIKTLLFWSFIEELDASDILTLQFVDEVLGTIQL